MLACIALVSQNGINNRNVKMQIHVGVPHQKAECAPKSRVTVNNTGVQSLSATDTDVSYLVLRKLDAVSLLK